MIFLRSLLFNLWFYGVTAALAFGGVVPRIYGARRPRRATPDWAMGIAKTWARLTLCGLQRICGVELVVTGREHLPTSGPALIASMHQSAFDTTIWLLLVPRACYVLKRELLDIPVFGPMCRLSGMIAVDRGAGAAAIRSLLVETDRAVAQNRQMVIFPEGTRAPPGARLPLQPGIAAMATRSKLPVIPVTTDSGFCWGRRAFRKCPGVIHIAIGPPIEAGLRRDALMVRLEQAFVEGEAGIARQRAGLVDNSVGQARNSL